MWSLQPIYLLLPSLVVPLLQSHRPCLNLSVFPPQDLCTCCSFYLDHPSPSPLLDSILFVEASIQMPLPHRGISDNPSKVAPHILIHLMPLPLVILMCLTNISGLYAFLQRNVLYVCLPHTLHVVCRSHSVSSLFLLRIMLWRFILVLCTSYLLLLDASRCCIDSIVGVHDTHTPLSTFLGMDTSLLLSTTSNAIVNILALLPS